MKTRVEYLEEIRNILGERRFNSRNNAFKIVEQSNGLVSPYEVDKFINILDKYYFYCNVHIYKMYETSYYARFDNLVSLIKYKEPTQAEKVHLSRVALRL